MAQLLSYAGVTLPLTTPDHGEWLDLVHPQHTFVDSDRWNFEGTGIGGTGSLPTPTLPVCPRLKFGTLHWPRGACRPAWFHAVVTTDILNEILAAVPTPSPEDLVLFDGRTGKTITALMYMLPARPLNQLGHGESDAWVLTLTDQRFFWQWKRGVIAAKPSSWSDLFTTLGGFLGVSINVDAINGAYATPSRKWVGYYRPTPAILDAAAESVGQRVVVSLDGTVSTVKWVTAKQASDSYLSDVTVLSGGFLSTTNLNRSIPDTVKTLFASTYPELLANNGRGPVPWVETDSTGGTFPAAGVVFADLPYDTTNAAAVASYAEAAAYDWYGWLTPDTDVVFPGVEPWTPTGWEDVVEWTFEVGGEPGKPEPFASTLIRRGPWDDAASGDWSAGLNEIPNAQVPIGCNLRYASGELEVDVAALVGPREETGMTTYQASAGACLNVSVDPVIDSYTFERPVVGIGEFTMASGLLRLPFTFQYYANGFNEAANIITRFPSGGSVVEYRDINICDVIACCTASALVATIDTTPDPATGAAPLTVNFGSTVTGGVPPYTYSWVFPGGSPATSSVADPGDVEFTNPGVFSVTLSVTDYCGNPVTATPVTVTSENPYCDSYYTLGAYEIGVGMTGGPGIWSDPVTPANLRLHGPVDTGTPGEWLLEIPSAGTDYEATGWDGSGCRTFTAVGTPNPNWPEEIEVCCGYAQQFINTGPDTFTVPAGVTEIVVHVWGAGAGGSNPGSPPGNGGGGGAYARSTLTVTPLDVLDLYVGDKGTFMDPSGPGEDSWFIDNTTVLAKGGGAATGDSSGSAGMGGSAASSIGDFKYDGGNGVVSDGVDWGSGGSSAGYSAAGNNAVIGVSPTQAPYPGGRGACYPDGGGLNPAPFGGGGGLDCGTGRIVVTWN